MDRHDAGSILRGAVVAGTLVGSIWFGSPAALGDAPQVGAGPDDWCENCLCCGGSACCDYPPPGCGGDCREPASHGADDYCD